MSEFLIETINQNESKVSSTIKSLCFPQNQEKIEFEIFACDKINQSKGLTYTYDYHFPDIGDYGSELKKAYNLLDVQGTTCIKKLKTLLQLYSH